MRPLFIYYFAEAGSMCTLASHQNFCNAPLTVLHGCESQGLAPTPNPNWATYVRLAQRNETKSLASFLGFPPDSSGYLVL